MLCSKGCVELGPGTSMLAVQGDLRKQFKKRLLRVCFCFLSELSLSDGILWNVCDVTCEACVLSSVSVLCCVPATHSHIFQTAAFPASNIICPEYWENKHIYSRWLATYLLILTVLGRICLESPALKISIPWLSRKTTACWPVRKLSFRVEEQIRGDSWSQTLGFR